ncbi:MAG: polysaccharide biosynthesis protein [Lachnospiraceae bacterium]|nr:polysaccharide biosynthesis protein [Lachnospiraceae bacterium]
MNLHRIHQRVKDLNQNLVIRGTLILTLAGFSTRIIGFYNRIFLADLIGAEALGVYQLIFPLYMVAFSFTTMGNELALTKLVSEYKSRCDYLSAKTFFRVCFCINLFLGVIISVIMYQNADWLCTHVLNAPESADCLRTICTGIPFMSMKGAIHGYFLGLEKSSVHGISDFLEQCAKVLGLYVLSAYICQRANYSASFAVWGIVIGEIISFTYSIAALLIHNCKCQKNKYGSLPHYCAASKTTASSAKPIYYSKAVRLFLKDSVPLTTNRLALTVLQSIEAILIPSVLLKFYKDSSLSLTTYGVFSGMAFPFIMFPSTITGSLSTMLLPAVSSANSRLDTRYLSKLCEKSLHFCLLIGLFATITFYIYGPSIGMCFFNNKEAGQFLFQLSFLCPFIYLATNLASMLNGLGLATHNLMLTVIATGIRIGFILFAVPKIGMSGYIAGMFVSYLILTFACLHKLEKIISFRLFFLKSIFYPAVTFIILGCISFFGYCLIYEKHTGIPPVLLLFASIGIYGLVAFTPFLTVFGKT